jgi:acetoacetyl-CoA synthetase
LYRDGVLNPSGVRFGSAEIYNVVRLFPAVEDSVCVGQRRPQDNDEAVILFLKVPKRSQRTEDLISEIRLRIERDLSKRHVPKFFFYIDDIPYSNVGKKLETVVKNIVCGRQVKSSVVGNPESLALYEPYFKSEEMARKRALEFSKL